MEKIIPILEKMLELFKKTIDKNLTEGSECFSNEKYRFELLDSIKTEIDNLKKEIK